MRKISIILAAAMLALGFASHPALAQSSPSGNMQAPTLQPKTDGAQPLPPALPGAGDQDLATAPSVAKPQTGDPTAQLFTAINGNDYNSALDAISRGADLNGENALGETPIDLSVSLNRNSITFMLLEARNDSGDDPDATGPGPGSVTPAAKYSSKTAHVQSSAAVPIKLIETPNAAPGNNPGTPNASAGFLGFDK
jgi:hypothetical protein